MREKVARSECMIDAYVSEGVMHVLHSSEIEECDRIYRPVKQRLARECSSLVSQAKFKDHDSQWVGGSYIWKAIRVYESCPGPTKDHDCCKEVTSVGLPIGLTSEVVRAMPTAVQARADR